eukprot:IDg3881t1
MAGPPTAPPYYISHSPMPVYYSPYLASGHQPDLAERPESLEQIEQPTQEPALINNQDEFSTCIVDSACYPSYTPSPRMRVTATPGLIALPDSTTAASTGTSSAVLSTERNAALLIPAHTHAPSFTANLLSVVELTAANDCTVVLKERGGQIVAGKLQPPPDHILGTIRRKGMTYKIDLSNCRMAYMTKQSPVPDSAIDS